MKIKVTKVFAKYLQSQLKNYRFEVVELSDDSYKLLTGEDVYEAEFWGDFNEATRLTKAIKVSYPEEYYASPRYLSTKELNKMFKGISTVQELNTEIQNALTI